MPENCILDPSRECIGLKRADEVAGDVKALSKELDVIRQSVAGTNERFGARLQKAETGIELQEERFRQMKDKLAEVNKDMSEFRQEQKDSISELRKESKESNGELKKTCKEILDAVTPLTHKVETLERLSDDVEELKEKPGKTWESIKDKGLGWAVAILLALLAAALGLSKYL